MAAGDLLTNLERLDEVTLDCCVVLVVGLRCLEPDWRAHAGTDGSWVLWINGVLTECLDLFHWNERLDPVIRDHFDLLDGVGGPETVKSMDDWVLTLDGCEVGDNGEVHRLLDVRRNEHGETGLTDCHNISMISVDGEGVSGDGTGGDMKHDWEVLTGDLVHVWDHEKEPL